jgi:hypothetical protein
MHALFINSSVRLMRMKLLSDTIAFQLLLTNTSLLISTTCHATLTNPRLNVTNIFVSEFRQQVTGHPGNIFPV